MADSLFDNRYRYDHIYPRGRSGETLRAYDTAQGDLPVVIKRPAPNDAPPIRAGQEVSIRSERKALKALSGHPVLTEVLETGQFFVGGVPHQYIVMERAEGVLVSHEVTERARTGERLPELETLVIVDLLLDLLQAAHDRDIVYNDVDAKHLFWNRETYTLKVIDWGNVVFLDGDDVTPQGVSRQTDIMQVGELLYFILTGGQRAEIPRDANNDFHLNFGQDSERVHSRLQEIVSKAAHPNTRFRYRTIAELRRDLETYRRPLLRERDATVSHVAERLRRNLSKNDLRELAGALEPALLADPGHPQARSAHQEIHNRLRDLGVSADLDAIRIYLKGGNWSRSTDLLNELRGKTGPQTAGLVNLLLDCCMQMLDDKGDAPPPGVIDSIMLLFDGKYSQAARLLMTQDGEGRQLRWLLAERISARIDGVLLLRPNLYRLDLALRTLAQEGVNIHDGQNHLDDIHAFLDRLEQTPAESLPELRYDIALEKMTALHTTLSAVARQQNLSPRKLPLTALERAMHAADTLANNTQTLSRQAASSPRDATRALDHNREIDPLNPIWEGVGEYLNALYRLLQSYQTYVPVADGGDVASWLNLAQQNLASFAQMFSDPLLVEMNEALHNTAQQWATYADSVVLGNRAATINALIDAAQATQGACPALSVWLKQLRAVVSGASYLERHAVSGGFGRTLADGWETFDKGRLTEAERLAQHAAEIARSETERFAARRLKTLASAARAWVERNGILDAARTQATLRAVESLYEPEEAAVRDQFAAQMPTRDTYLKAMHKGLIEVYARTSAPALRVFFIHTLLLGALEAHDDNLDDAQFWREVGCRLLGDYGPRHTVTLALDDFIARCYDLNAAETLLNTITNADSLGTLADVRRKLEENPRAKLLAPAVQSLRELENALRDWSDGEFRAGGLKLENAIKSVTETEQLTGIHVTPYWDWLAELQATTAELHALNRQMRQAIERRPAEPVEIVQEAHLRLAETTHAILGEVYSAQLRRWHETYEAFLRVYTDKTIRRSARLERFDDLFREMFIDRHPAYALYRHWTDLTDKSPEFPAPPTDDPTPRIAEGMLPDTPDDYRGARYSDPPAHNAPVTGVRLPTRRTFLFLLALIPVMVGVYLLSSRLLQNNTDDPNIIGGVPVTLVETPTDTLLETVQAADVTDDPTPATEYPTPTPASISLITPTLVTPTTPESTGTRVVPTETPTPPTEAPVLGTETLASAIMSATQVPTLTPTNTPEPTLTHTPTNTPTPTLPPAGLQGWQDILALRNHMESLPWREDTFSLLDTTWRLGTGQRLPDITGEMLVIAFPPETLNLYYGNNAPSRIRRTEATLALTTFEPSLLEPQEVYFGLLLQSTEDPALRVGLYLQASNLNVLNFWQIIGEETVFVSQRAVNTITGRLRLERNPADGTVTAFFNDAQIGDPMAFTAPEAAVQPALFVRNGGVIVTVVNWRVGLR